MTTARESDDMPSQGAPDPERMGEERENFIPVTRFALAQHLLKRHMNGEAGSAASVAELDQFFTYLGAWRHQNHQERLMRLKECYMPFSPDRDTVRVLEYTKADLDHLQESFVDDVRAMLERANYVRITKADLERLLTSQSAHGLQLRVDLSEFDEALMYYRGCDTEIATQRRIQTLYLRKEQMEVPIYQRLFLMFKLKPGEIRLNEIMSERKVDLKRARKIMKRQRKGLPSDDEGQFIYLKLFKRIPREDLEMMFPNTQVQFKLFDKIKLGVTAGGGTLAGVVGAASKIVAATNPITLAIALGGLVGVVFRQVMSFFNTRNKYMLALSQRLYFHSLADNRGVLTLLVDRGEEEDIKEEMLLYTFLLSHTMPAHDMREMDEWIESFLETEFGVRVDFEIEDAIVRLVKDGMVVERGDGMLQALPPLRACAILERRWKGHLSREHGQLPEHAQAGA